MCTCLNCGKVLKKTQKKFCSSKCSAEYNNKLRVVSDETKQKISASIKKYHESVGHCANKKDVNVHINETFKKEAAPRFCVICGKPLKKSQQIVCSNECSAKRVREKTINEWLETGEGGKEHDGALPISIREFLFQKAEYKCEDCGFSGFNKKTGKTILQIHHIDGDCHNNNIKNIKVLCPNCHAMTENYMNLNKGKSTRISRYKKEE